LSFGNFSIGSLNKDRNLTEQSLYGGGNRWTVSFTLQSHPMLTVIRVGITNYSDTDAGR